MTMTLNHSTMKENPNIVNWCRLIISALVPCILGVFTIIFTLQQQSLSKQQYEQEQHNQLDAQRQTLFDTYINDVSNLLLQTTEVNKTAEKNILLYIRTKTLTALRNLNPERKKYVLLFLYESGFLHDSRLDLSGAELNDVQLIGPYKLDGLFLPNVFWKNAVFVDCSLVKAVFNQSCMNNAKFINSRLESASFIEAQLDNASFIGTSVLTVNFIGTSLVRANFLGADVVQDIDFTNADLSYTQFTEDQFQGKRVGIMPHDFHHALLPNRSFGPVNSTENLLKNGDAEMQCSSGGTNSWDQIRKGLSVIKLNDTVISNINLTNQNLGGCIFKMMNKTARVSQFIDLRNYSRLISMNKAMISFFAFFGCTAVSSAPYVELSAHGHNNYLVANQSCLEPAGNMNDTDIMMRSYGIEEYRLPKQTAKVRISFGVKQTLEDGVSCYFDNITLTIHKYHD